MSDIDEFGFKKGEHQTTRGSSGAAWSNPVVAGAVAGGVVLGGIIGANLYEKAYPEGSQGAMLDWCERKYPVTTDRWSSDGRKRCELIFQSERR